MYLPLLAESGPGDLVTQLGVGGIFAIIILREVFGFLAKKRDKNGSSTAQTDMFTLLRAIEGGTAELVRLHDVKDEDGVPVWYVRKSLERQIERLVVGVAGMTKAVETQTEVLEKLAEGDK